MLTRILHLFGLFRFIFEILIVQKENNLKIKGILDPSNLKVTMAYLRDLKDLFHGNKIYDT